MIPIQFTDDDKILNICYDNVFKAVFTKETPESEGALRALLTTFTGREVVDVSVKKNEPPITDIHDRQIRFDISCKFNDGQLADVEMCMDPEGFEPVRNEYYAARLFTTQNIKGIAYKYGDLKETYQISFVDKRLFFNDTAVTHHFEQYDAEHGTSLGGKVHIIIIELAKLERLTDKTITDMTEEERWAFFFKYSTDKAKRNEINEILRLKEAITMAATALLTISQDENEQALAMSYEKFELDRQSSLTTVRREGKQEGKWEVAIVAKRKGFSIDIIAEITGLSPREIAGL
jgi:predicted transposase/invertase (TIGR01784 family)